MGGAELSLLPNFQEGKGEWAWQSFNVLIFRGGDVFQGDCSFYIKDKLKFEIFNDKKSL